MKNNNTLIVIEGSATSWDEAICLTGDALKSKGYVKSTFADACIEREKVYPTGLPFSVGVAIPHTDSCHVNDNALCLLRLDDEVTFISMEDSDTVVPVKLVLNMAIKDPNEQLSTLTKLMRTFSDQEFLQRCCELSTDELRTMIQDRLF